MGEETALEQLRKKMLLAMCPRLLRYTKQSCFLMKKAERNSVFRGNTGV